MIFHVVMEPGDAIVTISTEQKHIIHFSYKQPIAILYFSPGTDITITLYAYRIKYESVFSPSTWDRLLTLHMEWVDLSRAFA